jgi:hypothetical protein
MNNYKFLIICLNHKGMAMASIPLIKNLKSNYPNDAVHVLSTDSLQNYYSRIPEVEDITILKHDITPVILGLLKNYYSHIIDLSCTSSTYLIRTYLAQAYNRNVVKICYPNSKLTRLFGKAKAYNSQQNLSTKILQACSKKLKITISTTAWHYPILQEEVLKEKDLPTSHSLGYYVINTANISANVVKEVVESINHPVIILNTSTTALDEEYIQLASPKIYVATNKFTEAEQVQILANSKINIVSELQIGYLAIASKKSIVYPKSLIIPVLDAEPYCYANNKIFQKAVSSNAASDFILNIKGAL